MSGRDRPTKKFGSNLNRITRAPTAPPVLPGSGAATSSFRVGSSSSRNGLLLLSTKAKSEPSAKLAPGVAAVTGKLALPGAPKVTEHDRLLHKAGAGTSVDGLTPQAPAWGTAADDGNDAGGGAPSGGGGVNEGTAGNVSASRRPPTRPMPGLGRSMGGMGGGGGRPPMMGHEPTPGEAVARENEPERSRPYDDRGPSRYDDRGGGGRYGGGGGYGDRYNDRGGGYDRPRHDD